MIKIPEWVATATKDEVVAMAARLADSLDNLSLDAYETRECHKDGGCPACRPDPENCELRKADAVLVEWREGPGA